MNLKDDGAAADVGEASAGDIAQLGEKKKSRRNRPDLAEFEAQLKAESGDIDGFEFEDDENRPGSDEESKDVESHEEGWLDSNRDYTYQEVSFQKGFLFCYLYQFASTS